MNTDTTHLSTLATDPILLRLKEALGGDAHLHLVGGTVRDSLLGLPAGGDLDLATALPVAEVITRLERAGVRVIPTGLQHQTVTAVPFAEEDPPRQCEITSFRTGGASPVLGSPLGQSIEEDLAYRDFTVNALAFDLSTHTLIDPHGGREDLDRRVIRAVHNPTDRFTEDPLRILRMVRFSCQLAMAIAPETLEASRAFATTLRAVSVERVREEFSKTLTSQQPSRGLLLLLDLGFLPFIMPELIPSVDFEQNKFHRLDVFRHTLEVVENTAPDLVLRLSALLHDVGKPATLSVDEEGNRHFFLHEVVGAELAHHALTRLRYSNEVTESVTKLVRLHMRPFEAGPGGLRRILRDTGEEYDRWRALKEADIRGCKVSDEAVQEMLVRFDAVMAEIQKGPQLSPLSSLAVRGGDIMQLGTTEGPMIGEILRALHERVLDDPSLNTAEQLLTLAKSWIESGTFSSSSHARKNSRAS